MEVKPGYKQTEVGVIPEDWEVKALGEIAPIATGMTPPTRDSANYGNEFMFVSPVDMGSTKYITHTEKMLSPKGFSISRPFPGGSVLFVCIGSTIGKCGIALGKLTSNQQINAILPTIGVSSDYLYYSVCAVAPKVRSLAGEQAVPIVNKRQFSETAIPVPPTKAEQESIAEALSDADALIESVAQLIAKKRHLKRGATQELFRTSDGWIERRLGDVADIRDGTHQTPKYVESGVPFFSVENVTSGDFTNTKFISEVEHRFLNRSFKIERGDILMTRIGSIGDCKLIDWQVDASFYVSLALLKIRKGYSAAFICYCSQSASFKKEVELNSLQSAIPRKINLGPISDVRIKLPATLDEQTSIATILSDMDAEIATLEAKLGKARSIKKGMMQELLTGKVRLV
jgi:type I restriction enzyme S subunit